MERPIEHEAHECDAEQHADAGIDQAKAAAVRARWFMPTAKLSPINQATISITPWMPNEMNTDSSGALVKLRMPSKVVAGRQRQGDAGGGKR